MSNLNISEQIKIYTKQDIAKFINKRPGETKFGEKVHCIKDFSELENHIAEFVLLGIPEDIGVRANFGNKGTSLAWKACLSNILNIQHNSFTNANNVIVLGEINCDKQMAQAEEISVNDPHRLEKLGELVMQIDHKVANTIQNIIEASKFPIIIGGGHNNSYGNIKGTSTAIGKAINCINFDAHSDFRALEHRHSGNGFSYAFEDGFLDKYFIFGLHRNYSSNGVFASIEQNASRVGFNLFEDISINEDKSFSYALTEAENFCDQNDFGIEVDLDSIENMGSSAISPSGFSLNEARRFVSYFSRNANARYLHLCEGSPSAGIYSNQISKALAYLISDAICSR